VHARELMSAPVVSIPERTSTAQAGADYFLPYRYTSFPVVDEQGRAIGLVSVTQIETLARQQRAAHQIAEIADRDPGLIVTGAEDVTRLLERPVVARVGRAVVVDVPGRPVGLISITDVQRALRASRVADPAVSSSAHATAG
jgi:predicted transcriptional regulator